MNENENSTTPPHNPYAPEADEPVPNQYGQYTAVPSQDTSGYSATPGQGTLEYSGQAGQSVAPYAPGYPDPVGQNLEYSTAQPSANVSQNYNAQNPYPQSTQTLQSAVDLAGTKPNHLNVKVIAPTHFDEQRIADPRAAVPAPEPTPQSPAKLLSIVIVSIIALVCLVFGIITLVMMMMKDDELVAAQSDLANKTAIISAIEEQTGTTITSPADLPNFVAMDGYIYIHGWNIKLHIPQDLVDVSYILNQVYRQTICFNGRQEGSASPAFADVRQNPGGLGCLMRVATNEGDVDANTNTKFGTKVFTADGYNYFYIPPSGMYSTDAAEQGLENTAVQLIKTMVSGDNISTY